jgi:poly(3-hydroxybutyrate) depolymerase
MNSLLLSLLVSAASVHMDTLRAPDGSAAGLWTPSSKVRRPLVVWLHGGIGADNPSKGLAAAAGFVHNWGDSNAFALLAPSAWPASPWWTDEAARRVAQFVDEAAKKPGVDGSRIVLAGVSDGGSGALWLASRLRGIWGGRLKAVAVWSCDPDVLQMQGAAWAPESIKGIPLRWTAGGRDHLYPLDRIRWWWSRCARSGVAVDRHETPEADHDLAFHQADLGKLPAWVRLKAK